MPERAHQWAKDLGRTIIYKLHRRLGLVCGAVDLALDASGRWFFLETNQAGEWGWLSREIGIPIAAAIADALTGVTA